MIEGKIHLINYLTLTSHIISLENVVITDSCYLLWVHHSSPWTLVDSHSHGWNDFFFPSKKKECRT